MFWARFPACPEYSMQQDFTPKTQKESNSVPSENETRSGETPQQVAAVPRESGAAACLQGLFGEGLHCTAPGCPVPSAPVTAAVLLSAVLPCCHCVHLHWTGAPHSTTPSAVSRSRLKLQPARHHDPASPASLHALYYIKLLGLVILRPVANCRTAAAAERCSLSSPSLELERRLSTSTRFRV